MDLLYLYPFYNTPQEIENLRFDGDFMQNELNAERLTEFADRFGNKELQKRVEILKDIYD